MKLLILVVAIFIANSVSAQECNSYYLLQANKTIEMTIYNKKGDPVGKQVYTVSDVKNSGGSVTAAVASEMFDKKGKSTTKGASTIKCTGGVMMMDLKMSMPQQQASQFDKAEAKAENVYIEYPSNMNVGSSLKDGNLDMEIDNNGLKSSVSMKVTERKVEAKENVTTTAGTWECYKISFKGKMNMRTMGVGIPVNLDGTEWFAPGFGIVKTESKHGATAITAIR
jgi:hypothetical protein